MPIFEFRCLKCGRLFEKLFLNRDEEVKIECPECHSDSFERVISKSSYKMAPATGSQTKVVSKSCGSGNDCVTLEVPGYGD